MELKRQCADALESDRREDASPSHHLITLHPTPKRDLHARTKSIATWFRRRWRRRRRRRGCAAARPASCRDTDGSESRPMTRRTCRPDMSNQSQTNRHAITTKNQHLHSGSGGGAQCSVSIRELTGVLMSSRFHGNDGLTIRSPDLRSMLGVVAPPPMRAHTSSIMNSSEL